MVPHGWLRTSEKEGDAVAADLGDGGRRRSEEEGWGQRLWLRGGVLCFETLFLVGFQNFPVLYREFVIL